MTFAQPLLLLTLLAIPAIAAAYLVVQRRKARYAVRFTNLDVLARVAAERRPWRRYVAPFVFLLALAALCVAVARPRLSTLVPSQQAAVILVVDVSGSMHATDVKPSRLGAAEHAVRVFIDHAPKQLRVGLIAFAGDATQVVPVTTDRALLREGVDSLDFTGTFGGTAIGDALALAVQAAQAAVGPTRPASKGQTVDYKPHGPQSPASIVFLSDGHQTTGTLEPLQGAAQAKAAGIPIYAAALGTPNGVLRRGGFGPYGPGYGGYSAAIPVPPDPATLHAIAAMTGGQFTNAQNAKTLDASYAKLGSRLGRKPGKSEVTNELVLVAALLLLGAGAASALWSPRLP